MNLYDISRSVRNLYDIMMFEGSMMLDETRHQLQMNKPGMSTGAKESQELDTIEQQSVRGSRKQRFITERDFFVFFRSSFTKEFQYKIDISVEIVKDAQAIINSLFENSDLAETEIREAQKIKVQFGYTHVYYEWLEQLTGATKSGEIFKYFPTPEQPSDPGNQN